MLNRIATALAALLVPMALIAIPPAAHAADTSALPAVKMCQNRTFDNGSMRVECRTRDLRTRDLELRYVAPVEKNRLYVEFNNGTAWYFAPCEYEDSVKCHWDAGNRGNGIGTSFIRYAGKSFRL